MLKFLNLSMVCKVQFANCTSVVELACNAKKQAYFFVLDGLFTTFVL